MTISRASEFIKSVRDSPENFYIIHYSCQNLNDDNEGLSPRITSIAVAHFATEQSVSFSTHAVAEELKIARGDVIERFDDVERELLSQFYEFLRDRRDKFWVHWNMRNATYGFEHIEHRGRVLGLQNTPVIPVERRINLNDMIARRYGANYVAHPKMTKLMDLNGGRHRDFLSGAEEVAAFQNNEFMRMHMSTLCKVGFFENIMRKFVKGRLKTSARGWGARIDRMFESRWTKVITFLGTILGICLGLYQINLWVSGGDQSEEPSEEVVAMDD